ncbi:rod shape-determining protein MreD [Aliiroseovarius sp. KMU-50]|uniref:Rod shape-determining protein MreD n=1 Tax=Aliiroseovarius salicola TaxID=3009082 RepID=A0ABT4VZ08_9RHOB|nr:rod shape-determining protein MreD [Aliiroseovarius sp. KMU-50]MDA5093489.1 rod shape-determining protein MreD [Aliiroseovarius sp. KMU-50]
MMDRITFNRWFYRLVLIAVAVLVLFVRMLPLDLGAGRLPGPDLLLVLVMAWVLRRPDYAPVFLIAALFFLADMLLLNTPGVRTMMIVIGTEFLRRRESSLREQSFLMEFGMVAGTLVLMFVGQRLLMGLFLVEQVSLGRETLFLMSTVASYPFAVLATVYVFGIRKLQPGGDEISGQLA